MGDDLKPLIPPPPAPLPKIPSLPPRDTEQIPPLLDCRDTAEVAPLDLAALTRELDKQGRASATSSEPASSALASSEPAIAVSGEVGGASSTQNESASSSTARHAGEAQSAVVATSAEGSADTERHVSVAALVASRAASAQPTRGRGDRHLATLPVRALRDPRTIAIGAMAVAGVCVIATIGTIVWARNAVARAERSSAIVRTAAPAQVTPEPAAAPIEAAPPPVALPAPGSQPPPTTPAPVSSAAAAAPAQPLPPSPRVANVNPDAKSTALAGATCRIDVSANVRGATVRVDGTSYGTAPATIPSACDKLARVEVRHPRYDDFKDAVMVRGHVAVKARLEREKTQLTVWSHPEGAMVTYNGNVIGKTPLVTKVNRYEQGTLWFRAPGYTADWRRIVPKEKTKTVTISLSRAR